VTRRLALQWQRLVFLGRKGLVLCKNKKTIKAGQ
jgi:hypothetical protein